MAKCEKCGKFAVLAKEFNGVVLCNTCANVVNYSSWGNRIFSNYDELIEQKNLVLKLAKNNDFSENIINKISKYFDDYINEGFIVSINGRSGQILTLFKEYFVINTKESSKNSLINMFYQFDDDDYDCDDDNEEEVFSVDDKLKLAKSLITGGVVKTGISVAISSGLKQSAKEQKEEQRSKERYKKRQQKEKKLEKNIIVGNKKYYYKDFVEIDTYSRTNTSNGYIKFVPLATNANDLYNCIYFFYNNSIPFESKKIKAKVEYIKDIISDKVEQSKKDFVNNDNEYNSINNVNNVEIYTEKNEINNKNYVDNNAFEEIRKFKQLFDEGIISEEEFNKKKKELLNL